MGKKRIKGPRPRRSWRAIALGALVLVGLGGLAGWWFSTAPTASAGTPRLVVDRPDVDLGYRRFETMARVTFTLSNAGDGPLVLAGVPRVVVKAGC